MSVLASVHLQELYLKCKVDEFGTKIQKCPVYVGMTGSMKGMECWCRRRWHVW